ncbi:ABC-type transporter MlaC component/energy-coupling factor transporter ATP-binding protein EcfA2 [Bradyrhizobium sp. S3.9.2]
MICVGPHGIGSWQQREQAVALDRKVREPLFPVIPLLLPGAQDPPLGFLRLQTWVDLRLGPGDNHSVDLLERAIRGDESYPEGTSLLNPRAQICPYRGLEPFREEDAPFFVGREAFTQTIAAKVGEHGLVGVVGPSGSGKSSVVLAGLVPALRRSTNQLVWDIGAMRPGVRPLRQLAAVFLPPDPGLDEFSRIARLKERAQHLASGAVTLADVVAESLARQRGTDRFLLVVDQWEELYTHAKDDGDREEREAFLRVLLEGSEAAPLSVVLTLRGDFFGRVLESRPLADRLQDGWVTISPMHRTELRRAIIEPATTAELEFEAGLVDQILSDIGDEPANLPLLEFLLKELWDRRERDGRLTFAAYAVTGGVRRAIAERAEREFDRLTPAQRVSARRFFIRLVTPGEGREDTRARVAIPQADTAVREVIDRFAQARLLTTGLDAASGREMVEVGHEALIREWGTLRAWVDADREFLRTVERVKGAMRAWADETVEKSERLLPPGRPLEEARELLRRPDAEIDDIKPFIKASLDGARARSLRRYTVTGMIALVVFGAAAFANWQSAEMARIEATAKENAIAALASVARERDKALASSLWAELEFRDEKFLDAHEVSALWQLTLAEPPIVEAFWSQLPENPGNIGKLTRGSRSLTRTTGLRASERTRTASSALWTVLGRVEPDGVAAIMRALVELPLELTPKQATIARTAAFTAIERSVNNKQKAALASTLVALPLELTTLDVGVISIALLEDLQHDTDDDVATSAFLGLVPKLTADQSATAFHTVLGAIKRSEQQKAAALALAALVPRLDREQSPAAISSIIDAMSRFRYGDSLSALMSAFQALVPRMDPEQTWTATSAVLAAMQQSTDRDQERALTSAFENLVPKLDREQIGSATLTVLVAMARSTDSDQQKALTSAFNALAPKLDREHVTTSMTAWLEAARRSDYLTGKSLNSALQALVQILDREQTTTLLTALLEAVQRANSHRNDVFESALSVIAPKLDAKSAASAMTIVLRVLKDSTDLQQQIVLASALETLVPQLDREQAAGATTEVLQAIERAGYFGPREALAKTFQRLVPKLDREVIASAVATLVEFMKGKNNGFGLLALATALQSLPVELKPEVASVATSIMLSEMQRTTRSDQLEALAKGLNVLAIRLTPEQSSIATTAVLDALQRSDREDDIVKLATTMSKFDVEFTPDQLRMTITAILHALEWADRGNRDVLISAFQVLAPKLDGELTNAAVVAVMTLMQRSDDYRQQKAPALALAALVPRLDREQNTAAISTIVDAMSRFRYGDSLSALTSAFQALVPRLDPEQTWTATSAVLAAMQQSTDSDQQSALTSAFENVLPKLDREQIGSATLTVLGAIARSTDSDQQKALTSAFKALALKLDREHLATSMAAMLGVLQQFTDRNQSRALPSGKLPDIVQTLVSRLPPGETDRYLSALSGVLAETGSTEVALASTVGVIELLQASSEHEHALQVVKLLKYPTAAGPPSDELLASLSRLGVANKVGLKEGIAFLEERYPEIDFDSLPERGRN